MKYRNYLLFILWIIGQVGVAQTIQSDIVALDEVVLSASRIEKKLKDVAVITSVIKAKDIKKSNVINFRDFLEYELPGVNFTNSGGGMQINMLGFGGKYILFLIDGEKIAGETFDNIDYNRINMNNIERIEIIKGASSSLYGSNAIGGVINIITKKPVKTIEGNLSVDYENRYQQQQYSASVGTKQKWGSFSFSGNYKTKNPYIISDKKPLKRVFDNGYTQEEALGQTIMAGFTDYGINPKISLNVGGKSKIDINSTLYYKDRNTADENASKTKAQYYDISNNVKFSTQWGKNSHLSIGGTSAVYEKYDKYFILSRRDKNYENQIHHANLLYDTKLLERHHLIFGAEYLTDELLSFMFESDGQYTKRKAQTAAFFCEQNWKITDHLTLVTGLRSDYHSEFGNFITSRLLGSYVLGKHLQLRGGYSAGFRSPTLKELYTNWFHPYGGGFQILGNTNLKVEKSDNFNVSTDYKTHNLNITGLFQFSHISDKINTVWKNSDEIEYKNAGISKMLNAEFAVHYISNIGLSVKGSYTFAQDLEQEKQTNRPHIATLSVEYKPKFINYPYVPLLRLSGKYISPLNIYGIQEGANAHLLTYRTHYEGYQIWRAMLTMPLPWGGTLAFGVNNLLNYQTNFASFYSSTSIGRSYFVNLTYDF